MLLKKAGQRSLHQRGGRTVCRVFVGYFVGPYVGTMSDRMSVFCRTVCRYCVGTMSVLRRGYVGGYVGLYGGTVSWCEGAPVSLKLLFKLGVGAVRQSILARIIWCCHRRGIVFQVTLRSPDPDARGWPTVLGAQAPVPDLRADGWLTAAPFYPSCARSGFPPSFALDLV